MFQFGLSADPTSAAVFDGNEHAVVATVVAVGASEAVTVTPGASEGVEGQPPVTYPFARVDVSVDEVLSVRSRQEVRSPSEISWARTRVPTSHLHRPTRSVASTC